MTNTLSVCRWVMIGYGSLGALVFSLYIVYDTQLMMGAATSTHSAQRSTSLRP